MISTIFRISWLNLKRDRVALALSFVLPIVFFSIFALVFVELDRDRSRTVDAALVLESHGTVANRYRDILMREKGLEVVTVDPSGKPLQRAEAIDLVRRGEVDVAILVPGDFERLADADRTPPQVAIYSDASNVLAEQLAAGLVRAGLLQLGQEALAALAPSLPLGTGPIGLSPGGAPPVEVRVENVLGGEGKSPSVAFFAAGIGVMFLLFSVSGRSAILIEERESGILARLLTSRMSLRQLILGRWLFLLALGTVQVTAMFVWGAAVFGLDLWTPGRLTGFAIMTVAAAAAAAGFGLLLATACRSRAQLNGISSVVVLVMSALGGSMFPRFLMPETLQRVGLLTFNAWALDGYQKVFWYERELVDLWPQVTVLCVLAALFLVIAGGLADRWVRG